MLEVITLDHHFLGIDNSISSYLIPRKEGHILIESGPHSTYDQLCLAISSAGYQVDDITHVLLTHIHFDHAGAAWAFAQKGAKIYVSQVGLKHMHDPSRLYASAKMIYQDKMEMLWGEMHGIPMDRLVSVDDMDEYEINGLNFLAIYTPGHAKHHIAWKVDQAIFTGDVAGARVNNGAVVPPCPPPDIDIELWHKSIEKLLSHSDVKTYYLTHFGPITDIQHHMRSLANALDAYAGFIKPYYDKGASVDAILPEFVDFVRKYLSEQGVKTEDLPAYEAANPANMSVPGLLRYWKKKTNP